MDAQDTIVVITGASRGLGAGMARRMAERGLRLGLCARSEPVLPEGERVVARRLDVTDAAAVDAFAGAVIERFGRIDLWINNAGVLEPIAPVRAVTGEQFADHLRVNLTGVFNGTRAFIRHVRAREGGGVLINISSGAARKPYAGWAAYCTAKAGVDMLTQCVQVEEAASGLRAYAVAPGVIDTGMQELIRSCTPEQFPQVERFKQMKRDDAYNTPAFVADQLLAIAFDPAARPDDVLLRLPEQQAERTGRR